MDVGWGPGGRIRHQAGAPAGPGRFCASAKDDSAGAAIEPAVSCRNCRRNSVMTISPQSDKACLSLAQQLSYYMDRAKTIWKSIW